MKTLKEIKNEITVEIGYSNFDDYMRELILNCSEYSVERLNKITDEICIRAQKAALENAADNSWINGSEFSRCGCEIDRTSITNPENLIL